MPKRVGNGRESAERFTRLDDAVTEAAEARRERTALAERFARLDDAVTGALRERTELAERFARLDDATTEAVAGAPRERTELAERLAALERRLLVVGGVAVGSLLVGAAALLAAFGMR